MCRFVHDFKSRGFRRNRLEIYSHRRVRRGRRDDGLGQQLDFGDATAPFVETTHRVEAEGGVVVLLDVMEEAGGR